MVRWKLHLSKVTPPPRSVRFDRRAERSDGLRKSDTARRQRVALVLEVQPVEMQIAHKRFVLRWIAFDHDPLLRRRARAFRTASRAAAREEIGPSGAT
jgi:hypothetical protein